MKCDFVVEILTVKNYLFGNFGPPNFPFCLGPGAAAPPAPMVATPLVTTLTVTPTPLCIVSNIRYVYVYLYDDSHIISYTSINNWVCMCTSTRLPLFCVDNEHIQEPIYSLHNNNNKCTIMIMTLGIGAALSCLYYSVY